MVTVLYTKFSRDSLQISLQFSHNSLINSSKSIVLINDDNNDHMPKAYMPLEMGFIMTI